MQFVTKQVSGWGGSFPVRNSFASYGASAVTRTSGRGHVAEAKTNVIEVSGFSIRVSPSHLWALRVATGPERSILQSPKRILPSLPVTLPVAEEQSLTMTHGTFLPKGTLAA